MLLIRFFGGKGGVGKTTVAAAFALARARRGERTLVASTDPAHSLGDVLEVPLSERPTRVAGHLWAVEVSGEAQARRRVAEVAEDARHVVPREVLPAVERHLARATDSPGTVESALLDRLTDLVGQVGTDWDTLVVDSAPTGHMVRLLGLPALLTPWIEGLTRQREKARDVEGLVAGLSADTGAGGDTGPDPLLSRLYRRRERVEWMAARLRERALVHLVVVPERLPLAETLRAADTLTDGGLRLGTVLINRVLDADTTGPGSRRRDTQEAIRTELETRFPDPPPLPLPLLDHTPEGLPELAPLADLLARGVP
ncbi:ArsA family ATPase [Saccharomonospora iraqiensis]|uniref:ArsA family ATPase n=1 Tax=Saccharomonospora iraqiensis TaxID=52698 RepID=UPI00022DF4A9|nr:ArsA family ATPase [Saccharomonospora iraqiensis]